MKRSIARQVLIAKLAALALSAICFLQAPVSAQEMTGDTVMFPSVGVAPGQKLRLTLFNPNGTPVRMQAQIYYDSGFQGGVYVASGFVTNNRDEFHSFDFHRSDIPTAGEAGTGRIQLLPSVRLTFSGAINSVVASMEIIEVRDGTSNTIFIGEVIPSVPNSGSGNEVLIGGAAHDILMGIVPGQTLRVTLFNPRLSGSYYAPSRVKLYEKNGNLIAQSPELVIPPGGLRSFEFNPYITTDYIDAGTNRALVRIELSSNSGSEGLSALPNNDVLLPDVVSFEVIDNSTGKTAKGAVAGVLWAAFHNN